MASAVWRPQQSRTMQICLCFLQLLSVGHLAVDTAASRGPTADYFGSRVLSLFVLQQLAPHSGDSSCCVEPITRCSEARQDAVALHGGLARQLQCCWV